MAATQLSLSFKLNPFLQPHPNADSNAALSTYAFCSVSNSYIPILERTLPRNRVCRGYTAKQGYKTASWECENVSIIRRDVPFHVVKQKSAMPSHLLNCVFSPSSQGTLLTRVPRIATPSAHVSAEYLGSGVVSEGGEAESADDGYEEKEGLWSIVIPTYNRLPILTKCLDALEAQEKDVSEGVEFDFEVLVVDDGSDDATVEFLHQNATQRFPHVRVLQQQHQGAACARNLGVWCAHGATVVFIDSDLVVSPRFLASHAKAMKDAEAQFGDECSFTYGRVVNTNNFEDPQSEPFKLSDVSAAFFATGNVAIRRRMLRESVSFLKPVLAPSLPPSSGVEDIPRSVKWGAVGDVKGTATGEAPDSPPPLIGPFDPEFHMYGWEDLELGERLRKCGARIVQCPEAVGFHWHRAFTLDDLPGEIQRERMRAGNAVLFFRKHPGSLNVRLMLQLTPFHWFIWGLLTIGGLLTEKPLMPLLKFLCTRGHSGLALALLVPTFNWYYLVELNKQLREPLRNETIIS